MQQETSSGGQVATAVAVVNKEKNPTVGSIGGIAVGGKMSRPRCKTCNKPLPQMACNDADCDQMRVMCCRTCCIKCGTPCYSGKCARVECPEVYPECNCEVSPGCCPDSVECANESCCVNKAKPKHKASSSESKEEGGEEEEGEGDENIDSPTEGGMRRGGKTVIRTGTIVYAGSEHEGTEEETFKKIIGHKLYHFLSERTNPRADAEIFVEQECMKDDPEECEMLEENSGESVRKVKRHQQVEEEAESGDYTEPDSWLTQYVGGKPKAKGSEDEDEEPREAERDVEHVPIVLEFPTKTSPHAKVSGRYECKTFKFSLPSGISLNEALRSGDGEIRLPLTKGAVDELFGFSKQEHDDGKPKAIYPNSISVVCHTNNTPFHFIPAFVVEAPSIDEPGKFEQKQFTLAQYGRRFAYYNDRTNVFGKDSSVSPYHVSLPPTGSVTKQPRGPKTIFAQRYHPCMAKLFERWAGLDYRRLFDENVKPVPGREGVGMFDVSAEKDEDGLYSRSPNAFHYWFTRLDKLKEIARVAGASAKGEGGAGTSNSFSREAKSKNAPVLSDDETAKQLSAMWSPETKSLYVQIEPLWRLWKQQHDKVTKMHGDRDEEKVHPNRFMLFSSAGTEYASTDDSVRAIQRQRQVVSYLALRPILGATLEGKVEGWAGPNLVVPSGTSNQISVEIEFCFQKCHITGKMGNSGEAQMGGDMKEGDKRVQGYMRGNPGSEPGRSYVQGYSIHGGHSVNGHWSSNPGSSPGSHYVAPYSTGVNKQGHYVSGHMSQNQGPTPGSHYIAPYNTAVNKQGHHVSGYTSQNPGSVPGTHYVAPYNTGVSKQGHHVDPYSRSVAGPSTDTTRVSGYTTAASKQGHHVDPHSSANPNGPGTHHVVGYSTGVSKQGHHVTEHMAANAGALPGQHHVSGYQTSVNKQGHHVSGHLAANAGSAPGKHEVSGYTTGISKQGHHVDGHMASNAGHVPGEHYVSGYTTGISKQGHHVDGHMASNAGSKPGEHYVTGYQTSASKQGHHVSGHLAANAGPALGQHQVSGYTTGSSKQGHHVDSHYASNPGADTRTHLVSGYQTGASKQGHHVAEHMSANAGPAPGQHHVASYTTGSSKQGHHVAAHSASNPGPGPATHHVDGYTTGSSKQGDKHVQGYMRSNPGAEPGKSHVSGYTRDDD